MRIIKPSIEITFYAPDNGQTTEQAIEATGRTCYKSEDKITEGSSEKFVRMLRGKGHEAVLEFGYATARIIADRGLTHELVRHRLCSFAQESTRYCNYSKGKFNTEITVIEQKGIAKQSEAYAVWFKTMCQIERSYMELIDLGISPETARSILPIGLKTEIVIGANLREWRHIFEMRCSSKAHPIIREVMRAALEKLNKKMPSLYADLAEKFIN